MTEAMIFVQHARSLVGRATWRHRSRKAWAVDCAGVAVYAMRKMGLDEHFRLRKEDEIPYGREPWDDMLRKVMRDRFGEPFSKKDAQPGDISLIRRGQGEPSHVGVIGDHPCGGLSLIHATNIHGVVEHALSGPFLDCIVEVYRPWPKHSHL